MPGVIFDLSIHDMCFSNFVAHADVEIHHLETRSPINLSNVKVVAEGPLRAAVEAEAIFGKSHMKVTVRLKSSECSLVLIFCTDLSRRCARLVSRLFVLPTD